LRESFSRRAFKAIIRAYMRAWHDLELRDMHNIPTGGPALVLTNHASILDTPVLLAADRFPNTSLVAKASMFRVPVVRRLLVAWSAIPVERKGDDVRGVRAILGALRAGRMVGLAPEGRRSRTGRLGEINPVLARLIAHAGVPVIPVGIAGSQHALPPGALFPRRSKIVVRVGPNLCLDRHMTGEEAARKIRDAIAALLPPDQQPEGWTPSTKIR
jgi:1-acyl-sn-glycerol-3-phosphate acyltransferase